MVSGLCSLVAVLALSTIQVGDQVAALIAEGRFGAALQGLEGLPSPERERLRRRALHLAGDLPGALAEGRRGLQIAPQDLEILLGTADVALVLGHARLGSDLVRRLGQAVDALPQDAPDREWWISRAATLAHASSLLDGAERTREGAVRRARWSASLMGSAALAALLVLALASGRRNKAPPPRGVDS